MTLGKKGKHAVKPLLYPRYKIHLSVPSRLLRGAVLCGNKKFVRQLVNLKEVTCKRCRLLMQYTEVKSE